MCIIILLWYYVQFFQFFEMPCILFNQWSNNGVIYGLYSNLRILLINDFASILKLSYLTMIILSTLLSIVLVLMIAQLDKLGNFSFRKIDK